MIVPIPPAGIPQMGPLNNPPLGAAVVNPAPAMRASIGQWINAKNQRFILNSLLNYAGTDGEEEHFVSWFDNNPPS